MLHRLAELDEVVRAGYDAFEFKRITRALIDFMVVELSAFYFDIRKDALYCDAPSSLKRKASVQVVRHLFDCLVKWLAPMLPFTTEEAWLDRYPDGRIGASGAVPADSGGVARRGAGGKMAQDPAGAPRRHRRAGDRAGEEDDRLVAGSGAGRLHDRSRRWRRLIAGVDLAEIAITSGLDHRRTATAPRRCLHARRRQGRGRAWSSKAEDRGLRKCARSWRYTADVGEDPDFPDVSAATPRCCTNCGRSAGFERRSVHKCHARAQFRPCVALNERLR